MDYESLIFEPASAGVNGLFVYFVVIMILDYIRTMIFTKP